MRPRPAVRPVAMIVLLATLALAGCVAPADVTPGGVDAAQPEGADAPGWPDPADAPVRPGARIAHVVLVDGVEIPGNCTGNFVFRSPDNATLYLGSAAHCFTRDEIGATIAIADGAVEGVLAYTSWHHLNSVHGEGHCKLTAEYDEGEEQPAACINDFALIAIPDAQRHLVHPAVRTYGGPTGLADSGTVSADARVYAYGNSGLRLGLEPAVNLKEGIVTGHESEWDHLVTFHNPGIPGDSGTGVLTHDGGAYGVLNRLYVFPPGHPGAPVPVTNSVMPLDLALAYAREEAEVHVEVATWDLLVPRLA